MLLEELTTGVEEWYYISVAADVFHCGYLVQGKGPTDAWHRVVALNIIPHDHSTQTTGPIEAEIMARIPESLRYRKLTREESEALGK